MQQTLAALLRAMIGFAFTVHSASSFSQAFTPPESGKTVDETHRILLQQELPRECVAWHIKGVELDVIVAVGKAHLEEHATRDAHRAR